MSVIRGPYGFIAQVNPDLYTKEENDAAMNKAMNELTLENKLKKNGFRIVGNTPKTTKINTPEDIRKIEEKIEEQKKSISIKNYSDDELFTIKNVNKEKRSLNINYKVVGGTCKCPCGSILSYNSLNKHKKSKKHSKWLKDYLDKY